MSRYLRLVVVGLLSTVLMTFAAAPAWADDESIILDLVRHGESTANAGGIIDTEPPGAPLDSVGQTEATTVGNAIFADYGTNIAGVYDSQELRTQETAQPLLDLLSTPGHTTTATVLSGLNEISAGTFQGEPTNGLDGILYFLGPVSWIFGNVLTPELGDPSLNGVVFDQDFNGAVQTIYDGTASTTGTANDVAFSSEGAIAVWMLMNVNNPDFSALLTTYEQTGQFLPNTGQVVIDGSPGDWTLVSCDGVAVPQDPGLSTELFVDFRNLLEAPQFAGYGIYEALLTGNSTTIDASLQAGLNQVDTALSQFPVEVFDQLVAAFGVSM